MARSNAEALKLPDQLLVRYFRAGEIDEVKKVASKETRVEVHVSGRVDHWSDLGGGLGYVPVDSGS
jgi:hypothetical protein